MARISIYLNDRSSMAMSSEIMEKFENYLYRHELSFKSPANIDLLQEELKEDVLSNCEYIFSVGGDGTANTILQNIHGSNIKLMVVPTGTANDFATELGLNLNMEKIMKVFLHKTHQRVDTLKINNKYMVSNGGFGLTAQVAEAINQDRKKIPAFKKFMKLTGSNIYSLYFAKELIKPLKMYKIHIESPDYPRLDKMLEASIVMINNQPKIGGKFNIAPNTKNNDGKFNVTIMTHSDKSKLLKTSLKMLKGIYPHDDKEIISFETDQLDLTVIDEQVNFFGDGEILERSNSFSIKNIPNSLNVCSYDDRLLYCNSLSLDNVGLI